MIRRRTPPLGDNPDWSRAIYSDPASHDFCVWLIMAEAMRRVHGAPAPLKVRFVMHDGQLGLYDYGPISLRAGNPTPNVHQGSGQRAYSDQMIEGVLMPAIEMIGAVREPDLHWPFDMNAYAEYVEYDYHAWHLVEAAQHGLTIPKWTPPQWAFEVVDRFLDGEKPVVITLRESDNQPERNSRVDAWLDFAGGIGLNHSVLFVRDTARAEDPLFGWVWPLASTNAYIRAALYQRALVNMMVGNGPCIWCLFSNAPYLLFKQLVPELPGWMQGQPAGWWEFERMRVGDQFPWAGLNQRVTWADDTLPNIRDAFEKFMAAGEAR